MLETMRNHAKGWIAKIILGGIALSFVLWGVGDYFTGGNGQPVATINDKPVSNGEFYQAYQRQLNAYRAMLGKQFSKDLVNSLNVKDTTLQTIINRRIMLDVASELGLTAPETVVKSSVSSNPSFQSAGIFDPKRYQILTRNMGFGSAQDFENDLRLNIVVDALQKAIIGSVQVSEHEIRERFNAEYEQRVLAAIVVDPVTQMDKVTVSEAQAKDWYDTHQSDYRSPLRIKVNVVEINPALLAEDMSVNEAEIQVAYDKRKAEFAEPEQRKASHILVQVAQSSEPEVYLAARKKIEAVQARLQAGENFTALAEETSDDNSTKDKGGDLGWFKAGMMVTEFDQTAFSMDKGDVSDIVETQYGYHLIHLDDIRVASERSYAEMKDTLKAELIQALVSNEAYKLSQDLDDALGMEDSLQAAAESLDLPVRSTASVSMFEAEVTPTLTDPEIRSRAFSTLPGQAIEIIETNTGSFVAFEVLERFESDVLPYENVARKVMAAAKMDAANQKARELADQIRRSTKPLDQLAQEYGQAKYISKPVRSNGVGDSAVWLSRELLDKAFIGATGAWLDQSISVPQGYAAVRIEQVMAPSEDEFEGQKASIAKDVEKSKGLVRFARWMSSLRDRYDVVINEAVLDRF